MTAHSKTQKRMQIIIVTFLLRELNVITAKRFVIFMLFGDVIVVYVCSW